MEGVASEISRLQGVETREYGPGERLTPERLKQNYLCIRDGAIALRLAAGRATPAIVEVFGPGRLLSPRLWDRAPGPESRHTTALVRTTTLELPADVLARHVASDARLAATVARSVTDQQLASLDRLAMLAVRDPFQRVAHALLLLVERFQGVTEAAGSARLAVGQELIAAFAGLSRQTTNRQLRRFARGSLVTLRRQVVELRDRAALLNVAAGRRPPTRSTAHNPVS